MKTYGVAIRKEGGRIDGGGFLKIDLRVVQEYDLVLGHAVLRQLVSWCSLEEGLNPPPHEVL